jgi:septal ring factor EnvC (AmiA/AmiB activator)
VSDAHPSRGTGTTTDHIAKMNGLLRTSIELLPVDEGHADVINPKPTTTDLSVNRSHVISARMKTILQTAGEHDLFELCEAVCAKYTALVERENRLEEDIGRKKTEMEELRDVEMNLQARVHELEGDLYAHKIRTRNMETEKNQEIRKLQKEIKELEKTKKITLNRDKQYQVCIFLLF